MDRKIEEEIHMMAQLNTDKRHKRFIAELITKTSSIIATTNIICLKDRPTSNLWIQK
jgi:hypothetical protein